MRAGDPGGNGSERARFRPLGNRMERKARKVATSSCYRRRWLEGRRAYTNLAVYQKRVRETAKSEPPSGGRAGNQVSQNRKFHIEPKLRRVPIDLHAHAGRAVAGHEGEESEGARAVGGHGEVEDGG